MFEYLLAAREDESIGKIIFFAVFVLLWVGSAIASKAGKAKKKQKDQERRLRDIIAQEQKRVDREDRAAKGQRTQAPPLPSGGQPQPRRPIERKPIEARPIPPVNVPPLPRQQSQKQQRRQQRPQQAVAVPQQMAAPVQQQRIAPSQPVAQQDDYATTKRIAPAISAQRLHRVLRPKNMQAAYILTEILQPPMSLRDPLQ